jgi:hypothetical protein
MNEIVRVTLWIVLLIAGLAGYFLVLEALFASRVAKTRALIASAPGRSFGIGAVNFVFFSVIAFILFSVSDDAGGALKAVLTIPALLITAALVAGLSFGLAGMVELVGERVLPEASAMKRRVWGTACLGLACALPFAGWFLMLPYVGLTGIGAFILGFFQRESR